MYLPNLMTSAWFYFSVVVIGFYLSLMAKYWWFCELKHWFLRITRNDFESLCCFFSSNEMTRAISCLMDLLNGLITQYELRLYTCNLWTFLILFKLSFFITYLLLRSWHETSMLSLDNYQIVYFQFIVY